MESRDKEINLIAGRIMDEYRKHPSLEWNKIAASKIHSQWFEYFSKQTKALTDEIEGLKQDLFNIKMESSHEIADLVKTNQETQKELDETFHKLEGYIEHNKQLQSRISELEKANICPNCDGEIEAVDNDLIWTDVCVSIVNRENKQVPFTETLKYLKSKYTIKRNI